MSSANPDNQQESLRPHGYIGRSRLHKLLDEGHRVTIVQAEGGAGKTTLVSTWINTPRREGQESQIVWITIDSNRRSRLSFLHRLAESILDLGIVSHDSALERIIEGEKPPADAAVAITDTLNTVSRPPLVVVDDLHLLDTDACEDLGYIVEHCPGLRFIGLTRTPTTFDTGTRALRLGTHVISSQEMALTADEFEELSRAASYSISSDELETVQQLTSGNLLASRIALSTLSQENASRSHNGHDECVMERVAQALHDNLRPAFGSDTDYYHALTLSLVPVIDRPIAEEIIGSPCVLSLLKDLAAQGFGTFSHVGPRLTFSFHTVARAALSSWAERELPPEEIKRTKLSAALLMAPWGDPVTAIELFLEAEAYEHVWPFFVKEFSALSTYRIDDLFWLLRTVPDSVLKEHTTLATMLIIVLSERERRTSARMLQLAGWVLAEPIHLSEKENTARDFLALTPRFGTCRAIREYHEAADLGAELANRYHRMSPREIETIGTKAYPVLIQIVVTDILDGRLDDAIAHNELRMRDDHAGRTRHGLSLVAFSHALMGRMSLSTNTIDSFSHDLPNGWNKSIVAASYHMTGALIALEEGDTAGAHRALIPLRILPITFEYWPILAWVEGLISLVEGDLPAGYEDYDQLVASSAGTRTSSWANLNYRAMHADLAHAAGDFGKAENILKKAPQGAATVLSRARLELAAGRSAAALDLAFSTRQMPHTLRQAAESLLLAAVASQRLGTTDQALRHVRRASRIMSRNGLQTPLVLVPYGEISELLVEAGIVTPTAMEQPFTQRIRTALTQREQLVLQHLTTNATLADIAQELYVSHNTIKSQLRSIYRKLGVSGRDEAVALAAELRLLET
ncbi:LuxR C-terminal-related transcriptional regulator [Actinomycetaceae bacterium L2_0104]